MTALHLVLKDGTVLALVPCHNDVDYAIDPRHSAAEALVSAAKRQAGGRPPSDVLLYDNMPELPYMLTDILNAIYAEMVAGCTTDKDVFLAKYALAGTAWDIVDVDATIELLKAQGRK